MTTRKIVRPAPGHTAMDPYNRQVPDEGAIVRWSSYWERRLQEGVITISEIEEQDAPQKSRTKKARRTTK